MGGVKGQENRGEIVILFQPTTIVKVYGVVGLSFRFVCDFECTLCVAINS